MCQALLDNLFIIPFHCDSNFFKALLSSLYRLRYMLKVKYLAQILTSYVSGKVCFLTEVYQTANVCGIP